MANTSLEGKAVGLYRGTKELKAWPMTLGEYNKYRGWPLPDTESEETAGYLVEYLDGGKANDERHSGYISWSRADVFDKTYYRIDDQNVKACDTDWRAQEQMRHALECATRGEAANWPTASVVARALAFREILLLVSEVK